MQHLETGVGITAPPGDIVQQEEDLWLKSGLKQGRKQKKKKREITEKFTNLKEDIIIPILKSLESPIIVNSVTSLHDIQWFPTLIKGREVLKAKGLKVQATHTESQLIRLQICHQRPYNQIRSKDTVSQEYYL